MKHLKQICQLGQASTDSLWNLFSFQEFLLKTLTIHGAVGEGKGTIFIPLCPFHSLTNIHIFICNFACEMTIMLF